MLELLLRQYPGQVCLNVDQVARVLNRQPETIREWMRAGKLLGARRHNGRWMMPMPDLAEVLEPGQPATALPGLPRLSTSKGRRRRRAVVMN